MTILRKRGFFRGTFPRQEEFVQRINECLENARANIRGADTLPDIFVVFVPKGHSVGKALRQEMPKGSGKYIYNMEFSVEAIGMDFDKMADHVIPHEVAHIVEAHIYNKFSHSARWRRFDLLLGGTGERCHSMSVTPARKRRKQDRFEYIATCGTTIWVTRQMHRKIQSGSVRRVTKTGGLIDATCETGDVRHY